jgi:hypothetical protein
MIFLSLAGTYDMYVSLIGLAKKNIQNAEFQAYWCSFSIRTPKV